MGAIGAVVNVAIMAGLQAVGVWYLTAALTAALVTIVGNFVLLERFVFHDLREGSRSVWIRFAQSFVFNGSETALRTTALWFLVEALPVSSLLVQALLLAVGFVVRFVYHSRVVYRPLRSTAPHPSVSLIALDGMAQER
ncbi:GtrA family protein [Cryobacterium adonitolivorans]|uniref:GtrA family protein n=1 Tax=Cryobacterium adonitolivorans TaxID=1259189 RepID=UPI001F546AAA|nr:GtrA family protein [Cryobacterium adonitolivorans]